MGNLAALFYIIKTGEHSKQVIKIFTQGTLGLPNIHRDNYYCQKAINQEWWGVQTSGAKSKGIWEDLYRIWGSRYRCFCFLGFPSGSNLYVLGTGSIQKEQGCVSNLLGSHERICISSISTNRIGFQKGSERSGNSDTSYPAWQTQFWYSRLLQLSVLKPLLLSSLPDLLLGPKEEKHHLVENENLKLLERDHIRKELHADKILEESAFPITNTRRSNKNSH